MRKDGEMVEVWSILDHIPFCWVYLVVIFLIYRSGSNCVNTAHNGNEQDMVLGIVLPSRLCRESGSTSITKEGIQPPCRSR